MTTKERRNTDEIEQMREAIMRQTHMCTSQQRYARAWEGGRHIGRWEVAVGMIAAGVKLRATGVRTVVEEAQSHCG